MRRDEGEWPNLELATSIWPHNPTLRVPDKKGGSPAVSKNRGKGPPFAAFFVTAGAWGGTPQIVKKGVRRSQIHPADPKMGGFLPFLEKVALGFSGLLGSMLDFPFGPFFNLLSTPSSGPPPIPEVFGPKSFRTGPQRAICVVPFAVSASEWNFLHFCFGPFAFYPLLARFFIIPAILRTIFHVMCASPTVKLLL